MAIEQADRAQLEQFAAEYLTAWRDSWAPRTTVRKLAAIRGWAAWGGYDGFISRYRAPKPERSQPHPLAGGMSDVKAMLMHTMMPKERTLIWLCGVAGLRVGEAVRIKGKHFDADDNTLMVKGKGDKTRVIPVPDVLVNDLYAYIMRSKVNDTFVCGYPERDAFRVIARLGKLAGVAKPVATHDLRSTCLTSMYSNSKDIRAVQEFAGHASSATTEVYTGITMEAMRAAQEGIF